MSGQVLTSNLNPPPSISSLGFPDGDDDSRLTEEDSGDGNESGDEVDPSYPDASRIGYVQLRRFNGESSGDERSGGETSGDGFACLDSGDEGSFSAEGHGHQLEDEEEVFTAGLREEHGGHEDIASFLLSRMDADYQACLQSESRAKEATTAATKLNKNTHLGVTRNENSEEQKAFLGAVGEGMKAKAAPDKTLLLGEEEGVKGNEAEEDEGERAETRSWDGEQAEGTTHRAPGGSDDWAKWEEAFDGRDSETVGERGVGVGEGFEKCTGGVFRPPSPLGEVRAKQVLLAMKGFTLSTRSVSPWVLDVDWQRSASADTEDAGH